MLSNNTIASEDNGISGPHQTLKKATTKNNETNDLRTTEVRPFISNPIIQ
jgi:hypothetical protein